MKKREFLAVGGAVPLMLAGCGGDSSGNAPVRLINASVGYPNLGFTVESVQATTADVAYGNASPFENVQAGSVTTTLTVTTNGVLADLASSTRTLSKDQRYSMVAYGFQGALKSVLVVESGTAPDAGNANFNVLNTSSDIGAVDVYLSQGTDLSVATLIATSINGVSQSVFAGVTAGSYYVTVVGAGSVARGVSDVRFQTTTKITLVDQQIATLILTPGNSGVLANAILLTQGTSGTVTNFPNTNARVRAVAATGNAGVVAVGTNPIVLTASKSPNISNYVLVPSGASPDVQYTAPGGTAVTLPNPGTLAAGNDYTLLVYLDSTGAAATKLILDVNTLPSSSSSAKIRLLNVVYDTQEPLPLSLSVNAQTIASNIAYATASTYTEITAVSTTQSTIQVTSGFTSVLTVPSTTLVAGNIYTEVVAGVGDLSNPQGTPSSLAGVVGQFLSARL